MLKANRKRYIAELYVEDLYGERFTITSKHETIHEAIISNIEEERYQRKMAEYPQFYNPAIYKITKKYTLKTRCIHV